MEPAVRSNIFPQFFRNGLVGRFVSTNGSCKKQWKEKISELPLNLPPRFLSDKCRRSLSLLFLEYNSLGSKKTCYEIFV